ncbi:MAG: MoaD/ThiS family protein [Candidatus Binatia bacterium]
MSLRGALRRIFGRPAREEIHVHLLLKGRIGGGWYDVDRQIPLPVGATLATLLDEAEQRGVPLRTAIAHSPHLRHTLMLNGERCPVEEHLDRPLADGDEVYLLAPLAGG